MTSSIQIRTLLNFIFCLFLTIPAFSQPPRPSSPPGRSPEEIKKGISELTAQLNKATADTAKARLTLELANLTAYQDANAGLELSKQAIALAEKTGDEKAMLNSYLAIGGILQRLNRFDEALEFLKKGIPHIEKAKRPDLAGMCYGNIAQIYMRQGVYEKSLDFYQQSLAELEKQPANPDLKAMTLQQIGYLSMRMNKPGDAARYFESAIAIWEKAQNWPRLQGTYQNLGNAYSKLGDETAAAAAYDKSAKAGERVKKKD
ncbi:MAG: tetratricopeptide repeat protein [Saprospiraceae bacterium]|nr:tetratricopeptide repeat protein [Saprospiraceae bacterium]MCF8249041.1 tetratricopeptide repeat protein [Saprospiraceae bacterium]MCF8282666.1 tetratricopeptide repeat protein [Bacteroidales bacterium]MCF8311063.1 tetratricopeptide repeat protein [Saprospiraceae bacterium]